MGLDALARAFVIGPLGRAFVFLLVLGAVAAVVRAVRPRRRTLSGPTSLLPRKGPFTLQRYILGETVGPILLSVLALTFFLLIHVIYELIDLLAQKGAVIPTLQLLLISLPSVLSLTVPIAILLGVLLGIGRMAVENEIRACQVAGVHLGRIFWPMIVMCGVVGAVMIGVSYEYTPRLDRWSRDLKQRLGYEALSGLSPGILFDGDKIGADGVVFFFRARDEASRDMLQVCLMTEYNQAAAVGEKSKAAEEKPPPEAKTASAVRTASGEACAAEPEAGAWVAEPPVESVERAPTPQAGASASQPSSAPSGEKTTSSSGKPALENRVIFAARGRMESDPRNQVVTLHLSDGSIHAMGQNRKSSQVEAEMKSGALASRGVAPEMDREDVVRFSTLDYRIDPPKQGQDLKPKDYTVGEMMQALRSGSQWPLWQGESDRKIEERKRSLRVEWAVRTAISLACVAFGLLGIPLAIFVRPSGNSTGAVIAFGLVLVYYWMIKWGSSMAEEGSNFGFFVIFLPSALMAALGALLFRRAVRL